MALPQQPRKEVCQLFSLNRVQGTMIRGYISLTLSNVRKWPIFSFLEFLRILEEP